MLNILGTTEKKKDRPMEVSEADREAVRKSDFGYDYWDNPEFPGHKGYHYDGRWREPAKQLIERFGLTNESSFLDVGCGKGFLVYEMKRWLPGLRVAGLDISEYAVENGKEEIRESLVVGSATDLPFDDDEFDLVVSLATVYMLSEEGCKRAIQEISRVGRQQVVQVVSYRNEHERENMLSWDIGNVRKSVDEWEEFYSDCGYTGARSWFIFV